MEKSAFSKIVAQTFEAEDFLKIFVTFCGVWASFSNQNFSYKKSVLEHLFLNQRRHMKFLMDQDSTLTKRSSIYLNKEKESNIINTSFCSYWQNTFDKKNTPRELLLAACKGASAPNHFDNPLFWGNIYQTLFPNLPQARIDLVKETEV